MADIPDPFKDPNSTILRPRPGAGRRSDPAPLRAAPLPEAYEPLPASSRGVAAPGLNPLVQAASPVLLLAGQLRGASSAPDVGGLRRHTLEEIRRFEERARAAGIANEIVVAARYVLCAGLDEAVLSTPWGGQSEWAQQTLLVALHREAQGGEKFFDMLDRLEQDPARHIDLMELQYLCLAFGFAGKYQVQDRGQSQLDEVQQGLYRRIRDQRGVAAPELSVHWKGLEDRRNPLVRYVPWWVAAAIALAALTLTFIVYYTRLGDAERPIESALAALDKDAVAQAAPAPPGGSRLKQLLANEEAAGLMRVQDIGATAVVTLATLDSGEMFASGSVAVRPAYLDALHGLALALNQTTGRIVVTGHTDDQPIRSLAFSSNFALSRERAATVAGVLGRDLRDRGRLEWKGAGDTQPISTDRAQNRRVEVTLIYSGS